MSKLIRVDEEVMDVLLGVKREIERRTNRPASMSDAAREAIEHPPATPDERERARSAQNLAHAALRKLGLS